MSSLSFRAICFDLDGTLLDTIHDLATALNAVLARNGYPEHSVATYGAFVGDGSRLLVERALPADARSAENVTANLAAFRDAYGRTWNVQSRPFDGIPELLDALAAKGIALSILSNKPHDYTVQCAHHYFSSWPFLCVYGQQDHIPRKPDPAGALLIAQEMGIAPEEFLFIGDSGLDMTTGHAAGMTPIGVSWGYRDVDELRNAGATRILDQPGDLLQ